MANSTDSGPWVYVPSGVCLSIHDQESIFPNTSLVNMVSGLVLVGTFITTMRLVNRNNRLALAGRRQDPGVLAFSVHVTFLQMATVWAVCWAVYKMFTTDKGTASRYVYHALASSLVRCASIVLEVSFAVYLLQGRAGRPAIRRALAIAVAAATAIFATYVAVMTTYADTSSLENQSHPVVYLDTTVTFSFCCLYVLAFAFMWWRGAQNAARGKAVNDAYQPFFAFLALTYGISSLSYRLMLAQLGVALCMHDLASLVYFVLFAYALYKSLQRDSRYWQSSVLGMGGSSSGRIDLTGLDEGGEGHELLPGGRQLLENDFEGMVIPSNQLVYVRPLSGVVDDEGAGVFLYQWCGREVVVKKDPGVTLDADTVHAEVTSRESDVLRRLHNPNVIQFYGIFFDLSHLGIVMEYCPAGDLMEALRSRRRLNPLRIALGVASGLSFLHSKNICHGDVKSPNIFLDSACEPKIGDFGESFFFGDNQPRVRRRTKSGTRKQQAGRGSLPWMSPEQVLGGQRLGPEIDVYSFGVVLWELLTSQKPAVLDSRKVLKRISSLWDAQDLIVTQKARPPTPKDCPEPIARLLTACMDEDPQMRPTFVDIVAVLTDSQNLIPISNFPLSVR